MEAKTGSRSLNRAWSRDNLRRHVVNPYIVGLMIGTIISILLNPQTPIVITIKVAIILVSLWLSSKLKNNVKEILKNIN